MASKKELGLAAGEMFRRLDQLKLSGKEKLAVLARVIDDVLIVDYDGNPAIVRGVVASIAADPRLNATMELFAASERSSARIKSGEAKS